MAKRNINKGIASLPVARFSTGGFTAQQIADAYRQSVGAGTMSEADFVRQAQQQFGVSANDLLAAQSLLLAPPAPAPAPAPIVAAPAAPAPVYDTPVFVPPPAPAPIVAAPVASPVAAPAPIVAAPAPAPTVSYTPQQIADIYRQTVGAGTMSEADFVRAAQQQYGITDDQLLAAQNLLFAPTAGPQPTTTSPSLTGGIETLAPIAGPSPTTTPTTQGGGLTAEQLQQIRSLRPGETVEIGGTIYQPVFTEQGEGENRQIGPLEQIYVYKPGATAPGQQYAMLDPTGKFTGTGEFKEAGNAFKQFLPLALQGLSLINPALAPFINVARGVMAATQGNPLGAIASLAGAAQGFGVDLPSGTSDVFRFANAAKAVANNDPLTAISMLVDSQDVRVALAARDMAKAIETGNPLAILDASTGLGRALNSVQSAVSGTSAGTQTGTQGGTQTGGVSGVRFSGGDEVALQAYQDALNAGMSNDDAIRAAGFLMSPEGTQAYQETLRTTGNRTAALNAAVDAAGRAFVQGVPTGGAGITTTDLGLEADKGDFAFLGPRADRISIGNDEANTPEEAAALARVRNPAASGFTFGGQEYTLTIPTGVGGEQIRRQADLQDIQNTPNFNDAFAKARELLGPNQTFPWFNPQTKQVELKSTATAEERPDLTGKPRAAVGFNNEVRDYVADKLAAQARDPNFNPADLSPDSLRSAVNVYANATAAQKAALLAGSDGLTFKVVDQMLRETQAVNPRGEVAGLPTTGIGTIKPSEKGVISTARDVIATAGNMAAADIAGLGVRAAQFMGNVLGADTTTIERAQDILAKDKDKEMSKLVGNERAVAVGLASAIESSAAWMLGGPAAAVTTIGAITANNSWQEGASKWLDDKGNVYNTEEEARRRAGSAARQLTPKENGMRTAAMTSIEIAGELLGIPGMKQILGSIPLTGSKDAIINGVKNFLVGAGKENVSELLTTVAQFGVDKFASFGLSNNATFEDFKNALVDTVVATTAAVGGSKAIVSSANAANNALDRATQQNVIFDLPRVDQPIGERFESGRASTLPVEYFQGANPITQEQADFLQLDKKELSVMDKIRNQAAGVVLSLSAATTPISAEAGSTTGKPDVIQQLEQAGLRPETGIGPQDLAKIISGTTTGAPTAGVTTGGTTTAGTTIDLPGVTTPPTTIDDIIRDITTAGGTTGAPTTGGVSTGTGATTPTTGGTTATGTTPTTGGTTTGAVTAPTTGGTTTGVTTGTTTGTTGVTTPAVTKADIDAAIAGIQFPAGITKEDVSQSIADYMAANPGLTLADVGAKITEATSGLATTSGVNTAIQNALQGYATTKDIQTAVGEAIAQGKEGDAALQAGLDKVAADLGTTKADLLGQLGKTESQLRSELTSQVGAIQTQIGGVQGALTEAIESAKAVGLQGDAALQSAIDSVASDLGTTKADLLSQLGKTEAQLKTDFASQISGVSEQVSGVQSSLNKAIADAIAQGKTGDAALQEGINKVASDLGTTKSELLGQLGKTESQLRSDFASQISGTQAAIQQQISNMDEATQAKFAQLSEAQKADVAKLSEQNVDLRSAIDTVAASSAEQIRQVNDNLSKAISDAVASGKSGDAALQAAIDTIAGDLGTTKADLLSQLGKTEAQLKSDFSSQISGVQSQLGNAINEAIASGKKGDAALQAAIDQVASNLGTTKADVLSQIGKTETELKADFSTQLSGVQSQLSNLSTEFQNKYDALSTNQKTLTDSLVQQGMDLRTAIETANAQVTSDLKTQYDALTNAQKAEVAARVEQGNNLKTAIDQVARGTEERITELGELTKEQIDQLGKQFEEQYKQLIDLQKKETAARAEESAGLRRSMFNMQQAQSIAQAFNMPQLANVFYYGKDFGSKKQQIKGGKLEQEEYDPLSVTKAGAVGEMMEEAEREQIAEAQENKENDINGLMEQIFGTADNAMSIDELLDIVKGA